MNYLLVTFSGRRDALRFYERMLELGYNALVMNTPRVLAMSCGVSVRVSPSASFAVRNVLAREDYPTYVATYYFCNGRYSRA